MGSETSTAVPGRNIGANSTSRRAERNWAAERDRFNDQSRWGLSTAQRFVLDAIEVHIAAHDEGWPTQRRLAQQTGLSERQVRRVIETLVSAGFLNARVIPANGRLPNGELANGRIVYSRGKPRASLFSASVAPIRAEGGHDVRSIAPPAGHDDRGGPDMVSDEWKEKLKEQNTLRSSGSLDPRVDERRESDSCSMEIGKEPEAARRVLEYWREQLWPGLRGALDAPERAVVILARLAEGFTERELQCVVDAARVSAWHQAHGQKQRLTVSVLFGKAEMVADLSERGRLLCPAEAPDLPRVNQRATPSSAELACAPAEGLASAQRLLAMLSRNDGRPGRDQQISEACADGSLAGGG